ncbi:MAG: prepilin peptidase [Lachnospiraceae bacterium]|nr:prepilin peptidase [Lachnospiraceae bacterium]
MEITDLLGFKIFSAFLFFISGAVMGSFLDCCAWRYVNADTALSGKRSVCDHCMHLLSAADLLPIASYLILRGRCRYCKERIPVRHFMTELFTAASFLLCYLYLGYGLQLAKALVMLSLLIPASLTDLDTRTVPNIFFVLMALIWTAMIPFEKDTSKYLINAALGGLLIPALILAAAIALKMILKKDCLGGADVKLLFSTGLFLGLAGSLLNIVLMCLFGLLYAAFRRDATDRSFAFVPSICLSTFVCSVFGPTLISIYLGIFNMEVWQL